MRMMGKLLANRKRREILFASVVLITLAVNGSAQKKHKTTTAQPKPAPEQKPDELTTLRDQYVKTTREYKASLERLQKLYEDEVKRTEHKRDQRSEEHTSELQSRLHLVCR